MEFALMFPMFLGVFIGLFAVSIAFYSYVTAQLAVREGTTALIHDPTLTMYAVKGVVCNNIFSLDRTQVFVSVATPDNVGSTPRACNNLNASEGQSMLLNSGVPIQVSASYTVPLPTISMPTWSNGSNIIFLGPILINARSRMTIP